jgi:hypothetical protein
MLTCFEGRIPIAAARTTLRIVAITSRPGERGYDIAFLFPDFPDGPAIKIDSDTRLV